MSDQPRELHDGLPVYRIPEHNLEPLEARIARMNKRAAKLGMQPIQFSRFSEAFDLLRQRDRDREGGSKWQKVELFPDESFESAKQRTDAQLGERQIYILRRFVLCTATGSLPRINGWAMAASIQHGEDGNILATVPGFETLLPFEYRTCAPSCDHCHQNRMRKDTYILQHVDGSWKQVGRNCLADFIRSGDISSWADAAEMLAGLASEMAASEEFDWDMDGGSRGVQYFTALEVLSQVAAIVRIDGWCSRTEARNSFTPKTATVDLALSFFDRKARQAIERSERYMPAPEDIDRAAKAIEWAQSLPSDVTNDYLWNIRVVSHRETITAREAGLAGSIIAAYNRHLEQEMKRAYERQNTLDEHFGEVGQRGVFTLTCTGQRDMESSYGSLTLYKFRDQEGRQAVWFTGGSETLEIGHIYTIKATVKRQDEYNGTKQTTLTRAAILCDLTALDECAKGEHVWSTDHYRPLNAVLDCIYCIHCGQVQEQAHALCA